MCVVAAAGDEPMELKRRGPGKLIRLAVRTVFVLIVLLSMCVAYGFFIEPTWLMVRHVSLSNASTLRVIFFTDLHHNGNLKYLRKVISTLNRLPGDVVCFGGDLAESPRFLDEALRELRAVNKPMYGVPGNHDYWNKVPFETVADCFRATGGEWLCDTNVILHDGKVAIIGLTGNGSAVPPSPDKTSTQIILVHYPDWTQDQHGRRWDLILAGHSHGGQVRLPFVGPVLTWVDGESYERGLFQSPAGPLYVGTGIGTFLLPFRLFCRPEIVVIDL